MTRIFWTTKERAIIRAHYGPLAREPWSAQRIVEVLGRKMASVRAAARRFGMTVSRSEWMEPPPAPGRMMALYRTGMNDLEIAEKLDCPCWTVRRWRWREGLATNWSPRHQPGWLAIREQVLEMRAEGKTVREIARAVSCNYYTLRNRLRLEKKAREEVLERRA